MTSTTGSYYGARHGASYKGRVLLVPVGEGEDWKNLRSHLAGLGWVVTPMEMETLTEGGAPGLDTPRLDGVELAIVVVGAYEGTESNLLATRGLLHLAGLLQGALGYRRLLVLVEDRVDAFLQGTGVPELSFTAGNIHSRVPQIAANLRDLETDPPGGRVRSSFDYWMGRMGLEDTQIASEVWLWAGGLVIAALCLTVAYLIFADPFDPRGGEPRDEVGEAGEATVTTADTDGMAGDARDRLPNDGRAAGPTISTVPAMVPAIIEDALLGQVDGRVDSLPSRCIVSMVEGEPIPGRIDCEGTGGLIAAGADGPWRSDISAVTLSQGVVGEVTVAPRPGEVFGATVELTPGQRTELEPNGSRPGMEQLVLEFSANNETVVLHRSDGDAGADLELTFRLGL